MRVALIDKMKLEIETSLRNYLREEGIELYIAANDNIANASLPLVELESIEDNGLEDSKLLSEIKVILGIQGKPWQCETLVNGIYEALHPYHITYRELTVLLMSLHVESAHCVRPRCLKKRTVMRYIVEDTPNSQAEEFAEPLPADIVDAECG